MAPTATAFSPPKPSGRVALGELTNSPVRVRQGLNRLAQAVEKESSADPVPVGVGTDRCDPENDVVSDSIGKSSSTDASARDNDNAYVYASGSTETTGDDCGIDNDSNADDDDDDSLASAALKRPAGHFAELLQEGRVANKKATTAAAAAAAASKSDETSTTTKTARPPILLIIVEHALALFEQLDAAINAAEASKGCSVKDYIERQ